MGEVAATNAELAAVVLERLGQGEGAISAEFVVSAEEEAELRREFDEARLALAELVNRAGG